MPPEPLNILCMKWGDKYAAHYVTFLRAMVRRHLSRPHRFICLTDDPSGIDREVECLPIPDDLPTETYPAFGAPERGWLKMALFHPGLAESAPGRTLYLDLDTIITGDLTPLIDLPGRLCISRDWTPRGPRANVGNSSVMSFHTGAHTPMFERFLQTWPRPAEEFRNDQWFISHEAPEKVFFPDAWCVSFKRHCVPSFPQNLLRPPHLPEGARVVIFHGRPNPPDAALGRSGKWHRYLRPAPWILDHWNADVPCAPAVAADIV